MVTTHTTITPCPDIFDLCVIMGSGGGRSPLGVEGIFNMSISRGNSDNDGVWWVFVGVVGE